MDNIIQEILVKVINKHYENQKELFEEGKDISDFILQTKEILDDLGRYLIKETLEKSDEIMKASPKRKSEWYVLNHSQ